MSKVEVPPAPVPAQWTTYQATSSQAERVHWKNYFVDPRLRKLIEVALENNRDLRIAAGRVQEAKAQFALAQADLFPNLSLQAGGAYVGVPGGVNGTGQSTVSERIDVSLSVVSYEVDFWGRLANLSEAARNNYLASEEARRVFQISLISEVATTYFTLVQLDELLDFARQTLQSRQQSLDLTVSGRDAGGVGALEVELSQTSVESARATLDAQEHFRNTVLHRLNYLVGREVRDLPPGLPLDQQGFGELIIPGLPSEVLVLRPDVMAAERRLAAAHANVDAARAAFLPKILLTSSLGFASQALMTLFSGAAWTFQPLLTLPIFDAGRRQANLDVTEARKVVAVADYEKTIQLAFREVADLLSARASLARQMRSALISEKSQRKMLEIAQAKQTIGVGSYLEVLERQRDLVAAQQTTVQLKRTQLESAVLLYKSLGGGA